MDVDDLMPDIPRSISPALYRERPQSVDTSQISRNRPMTIESNMTPVKDKSGP